MDSENRMRWQFRPGHYEVWYATLSHLASGAGFWIRHTLHAPTDGHGTPSARVWFAYFDPTGDRTFGINRRFEVGELHHQTAPFSVRVADCELRDDGMRGRLTGAGRTAEWELTWAPARQAMHILPRAAYLGHWAETQVLSPQFDVRASGFVSIDGQRFAFDGDPLGQSHVWGRKHAYQWAWAHIADRRCAVECLRVKIRRGHLVSPALTMLHLKLPDETLEFREPWQLPLVRGDHSVGQLVLTAANLTRRVSIEIVAPPERLLMAEYIDPDGDPAYCHHTDCARATVRVERREGLSFVPAYTLETQTAHVEWGARAGDPRVRLRHQALD